MDNCKFKKIEYGLIGAHLSHSFSKEIHETFAGYSYELCELQKDELEIFLTERKFKGINVTIPYKQAVIPFLDEISDVAERIGAVNTIVNENGKLHGDNTDFYGLTELIKKTGVNIHGKNIMILGTGGTSNTAEAAAKSLGAGSIVKVSRRISSFNNEALDNSVLDNSTHSFLKNDNVNSGTTKIVSYADAEKLADTEIIINTTPCGMFPNNDEIPIRLDCFTALCGVIDVVYNPINTRLILEAKKRNIPCGGGLYMLVAQAVKSSELFEKAKQKNEETKNEETPNEIQGKKQKETSDSAACYSLYKDILKSKQNIVLTGMPGSGKTFLGKILAGKLQKNFVDTDWEIEKETGKSPADIIRKDGEAAFRKIETEIVRKISKHQGLLISTGGGTVLSAENVEALKQNGQIVFLDRDIDELDISKDRPLSDNRDNLLKLYRERIDLYRKTADKTAKLHGGAGECIDILLGAIQ